MIRSVVVRRQCATIAAFLLLSGAYGSQAAVANSRIQELASQVGVKVIAEGTSSSDVLDQARQQLPMRFLSRNAQKRVTEILQDVSQYRRMPVLRYAVNPDIYEYLVRHPDVAVSTWRAMGISELKMFQTGEFEYEATAVDGSEGIADVLWKDKNQCIFIVRGQYSSPFIPASIRASALVWLQYRFAEGPDGSTLVTQQIETFVHFPSAAIDTVAKLASRMTNVILDRNVFEVSLYARMMSQAAEKDPVWYQQLAQRMDGVLPQRKTELVSLCKADHSPIAATAAFSARAQDDGASLSASRQLQDFRESLVHLNRHVPVQREDATDVSRPLVPSGASTQDDTTVRLAFPDDLSLLSSAGKSSSEGSVPAPSTSMRISADDKQAETR